VECSGLSGDGGGEGLCLERKTYDSLSKVAFAITGTNWNGPRFFGLRDKIAVEAKP